MKDMTRRQVVDYLKELGLKHGVLQDKHTGLMYYTGYNYHTLYDWDMYFESIILAYMGMLDYTRNSLRMFLMQQEPSGFIARNVVQFEHAIAHVERREHCKPFLAQTALFVSLYENDFSWISPIEFAQLRKYLNYWLDDCDRNGYGLSEWNSAPHSGMDNQFDRAGGWQANYCQGVDLNSYIYRDCLALARIADELGEIQQAIDLRETAEIRKQAILELWDEKDGIFYDRHRRSGETLKVKYIMAMAPMWAGIATEDQAEEMVERYLTNEKEFWTPWPLSTYAQSEPAFGQMKRPGDYSPCNWCGCVWMPTNYIMMQSLRKYGMDKVAERLAQKSYELLKQLEVPREWYNAVTGEGYGGDPFFGWSGVAPFMEPELEHGCDPTDIDATDLPDHIEEVRGCIPMNG